jgi:putative sterol carrier protein
MELEFVSEAWVNALCERLNGSETYKKSAKGFKGSMAFALLPEADKGVEAAGMILELGEGTCKKAVREAGPGPYEADYVIRGVAENWKKLLTKEVFPVPAIMSQQLQLVKGNTMALMTQMGAVQALLDEAAQLQTKFPG